MVRPERQRLLIPGLLRMEWLGELGLMRLPEVAQLESVVARFLARLKRLGWELEMC